MSVLSRAPNSSSRCIRRATLLWTYLLYLASGSQVVGSPRFASLPSQSKPYDAYLCATSLWKSEDRPRPRESVFALPATSQGKSLSTSVPKRVTSQAKACASKSTNRFVTASNVGSPPLKRISRLGSPGNPASLGRVGTVEQAPPESPPKLFSTSRIE